MKLLECQGSGSKILTFFFAAATAEKRLHAARVTWASMA
jgi:hypothetical protein